MERPYPKVICNKKAEKLLKSGHPWVYGEETSGPAEPYENGDIVDVFTEKGSWMGSGFINDNSKIESGSFPGTPTTGSTRPSGEGASNTRWITGAQ